MRIITSAPPRTRSSEVSVSLRETDSVTMSTSPNGSPKVEVASESIDPNASTTPKPRKQAQLNFLSSKGATTLSLKTEHSDAPKVVKAPSTDEKVKPKEPSETNGSAPIQVDNETQTPKQNNVRYYDTRQAGGKFMVNIPLKDTMKTELSTRLCELDAANALQRSKTPTFPVQRLTFNMEGSVSRTTVVRDKNKNNRILPGPLLPLHNDLYDENLMRSPNNVSIASEPIALGFPTKPSQFAPDITYIIAFISKFNGILNLDPVGPADFISGLGLENADSGNADVEPDEGDFTVSEQMSHVFRALLTLLTNRKKTISKEGQKSAISDLRGKIHGFGLPSEWRDDSAVFSVSQIHCDPENDRVDESKPEISTEELLEYEEPAALHNPFLDKSFEEQGLQGIDNPKDRVVMLRTLCSWSLAHSSVLKTHLADVINRQESAGERDTFFASRSVLKGFHQTTELKKELTLRLGKRKQNPVEASDMSYIDPTSDPLEHPLALRLNEFIVGDCGFHVGRFYLVQMADAQSGGLAALEQIRALPKHLKDVRVSAPSSFALYVEDVHAQLVDSFQKFGVEFDQNHNEVTSKINQEDASHWYTVATNCEQLKEFLQWIGAKIGVLGPEAQTISPSSAGYKPVLYMYQYLCLILTTLMETERARAEAVNSRTSRRKKVDYIMSHAYDEDLHEEYVDDKGAGYSDEESEDDEYLD